MSCLLKSSFCVSGTSESINEFKSRGSVLQFTNLCGSKQFMGKSLGVSDQKSINQWNVKHPSQICVHAQAAICVSKAMRWWEKTLKPNMVEIHSAEQFVDSLCNAGDRLVIVDFYSPGCGGCKALHPKICQLAESNPDAIFLKVNYEELKTMCHALHIHVLPFFRFYRGAEGRLCSFSCTNATIKKFKDAFAKYGENGNNLGPAKGLEESELQSLASAGQLSWNLASKRSKNDKMEDFVPSGLDLSGTFNRDENKMPSKEGSTFVMV